MSKIDLHYKSVLVDPALLIPHEKNAAIHGSDQLINLARTFEHFGFVGSVVIGSYNKILAGHGRVEAALLLGMKEIPVIDISNHSEVEQRAFMIADNKLSEQKGWDHEIYETEFLELQSLSFDLSELGIGLDDILAGGLGEPEHGEQKGKVPEKKQFDTDDDEDGESREERYVSSEEIDVEEIDTVNRNRHKDQPEKEKSRYTMKVTSPIYTPKFESAPLITDIFDTTVRDKLFSEIESSDIPDTEKEFLKLAANRHVVLRFDLIAEYYAHAPKETQELMENSALVIIDFNKAIERGFVSMSSSIAGVFNNA